MNKIGDPHEFFSSLCAQILVVEKYDFSQCINNGYQAIKEEYGVLR